MPGYNFNHFTGKTKRGNTRRNRKKKIRVKKITRISMNNIPISGEKSRMNASGLGYAMFLALMRILCLQQIKAVSRRWD